MGFSPLDYLVLAVYLLGSLTLGLFLGRGRKGLGDYFLAGGNMPWWAISLSIVATETSTLTFIGAPAIAFRGDLTFLQLVAGYCVGRVFVSGLLIPGYFRGEIQTAYELLNLRFGRKVQNFSAFLFQTNRALADGVRLFATGLVLSVVTDLTDYWTVAIIGGITVLYTFYGGMRAVVWNDVVQLLVYVSGGLLSFFILLDRIPGGWEEVSRIAAADHKFRLLDFSLGLNSAYTFWAGLLGGTFVTFATHGTDQMMVQRYLSCGNRRGSQVALIVSGLLVFLQFLLFLVIGVLLYVFYHHFPTQEPLEQVDRIFPIFIVEQLPPGLSGLVIAAVFAAAMSTLSSSLNSLSSSFVNDFYRHYLAREASQEHYLLASRICTVIWAAVLIMIAMLARNWGEVLEVGLTITSITMGSVLGIFLLARWVEKIPQVSALTAMVAGLGVVLATHLWGEIAWTWYVLLGTLTTLSTGAILARFNLTR